MLLGCVPCRTEGFSFQIGPILVVDEPFTVKYLKLNHLRFCTKKKYLNILMSLFAYADGQWVDDSNNENSKGQSSSSIPGANRPSLQVKTIGV